MECCGKGIRIAKAGQDIVVGYVNLAVGRKYEFTDGRIRVCHKCDEQTWMPKVEYAKWLKSNGTEVLKKLGQLEKLPKLPKQQQTKKRRSLFCRICKCYIPAKARVKDEKCPLGKWIVKDD